MKSGSGAQWINASDYHNNSNSVLVAIGRETPQNALAVCGCPARHLLQAGMSVNIDPPRGPPPGVAQVLAEAALQRQSALLGSDRESAAPARSPGVPAPPLPPQAPVPPVPPLPVVADQVRLSPQARASLAEAQADPARPQGGPARGLEPGAAASAAPLRGASLLPTGPGRLPPSAAAAGATPLPPWPATGVSVPLRGLLAELVRQVTAPAQQPQRVVAVQPWPAALVPVVEGAVLGGEGLPGLPPLQNWLVRQGVVQTAEGERTFSLTLRVPVPWLQSQVLPAAAPALHTPSLAALFAGKSQALQSGTWALVLQSTEPAAARTSALLVLEFAPLAQAHVYGRELLQARQDPWLQMAVLQASGQVPKDEDAVREREAGLCQTPGCPYAGRASCAQPFCVALRVVQPSGPVEPMPSL